MSAQNEKLTAMYLRWREAEQRRVLAEQTLVGATRDAEEQKSKFAGALELAAGGPCAWRYSPDDGVTFEPAADPASSTPPAPEHGG